jgi:hypothetical protein
MNLEKSHDLTNRYHGHGKNEAYKSKVGEIVFVDNKNSIMHRTTEIFDYQIYSHSYH